MPDELAYAATKGCGRCLHRQPERRPWPHGGITIPTPWTLALPTPAGCRPTCRPGGAHSTGARGSAPKMPLCLICFLASRGLHHRPVLHARGNYSACRQSAAVVVAIPPTG